ESSPAHTEMSVPPGNFRVAQTFLSVSPVQHIQKCLAHQEILTADFANASGVLVGSYPQRWNIHPFGGLFMLSNVNVNENAPAAGDSGRKGKGQFQLGNKGGPGNPFAGQVAALRQAVLEHVSADDIRDIIKGLVEMAKNGHWQAAKLILQYAL